MLEQFVGPVTAQRLRACVVGAHLDGFSTRLASQGYARETVRQRLRIVRTLSRWMAGKRLGVIDLNERRVEEFLHDQREHCVYRGSRCTLLQLLEQLRAEGVLAPAQLPCDDSPLAAVLGRYEGYLHRERGLAPGTIATYRALVHPFVEECLDGGTACPGGLRPQEIRAFLLARVRHMAPKYAQSLAAALRSFLRFLFLHGETKTDLACAVLPVCQRQQPSVPRYLAAPDVERLLQCCDHSSAMGRRDHAVLLLLARLGLRASEVVALELDDIRWRTGEIVVRGKGLVRDRVPLLSDVGDALALYLRRDRPPAATRRVFLCSRAPHRAFVHPSSISTIVARALDKAGLTPPTRGAHLLRHSLATTMIRQNASLTEIGQVLRHRSPNSTEIYAKLDFGALREVARPWPTTGGAP